MFNSAVLVSKQIKLTQLYKYYKTHLEITELQKLIPKIKIFASSCYTFLMLCYQKIIDKNLESIIDDILIDYNILSDCELFANTATLKIKYNILEKNYSKGYNLNNIYESDIW